MRIPGPAWIVGLSLVLLGCAGDATQAPNNPLADCEASKESGLFLAPFGPITQTVISGGQAKASVMVVRGSATEGEGRPASNAQVRFRIISVVKDKITIDRNEAPTDDTGRSSVAFATQTDTAAGLYQVEASLDGTCPQTFTFDVRKALRQLRAVTQVPFDSFTGARIPLTVEASTNANARLANEEITFKLTTGSNGQTKLSTVDGAAPGPSVTVKTAANGLAAVMLDTGLSPVPQLDVTASMKGTGDVVLQVRIAPGLGASCKTSGDCPIGFTCKADACEKPAELPPTGCTSDDHCQKPTICDVNSGQCLEPTGKSCDPIEGTGCDPGDVCVVGRCATIPGTCTEHGECPATFRCVAGDCVPHGRPDTGGCITPDDCPANQTCVNGDCKPKDSCNTGPVAPDRLAGQWQYDSTLHLRQAIGGLLKGLLSLSGTLRDIIEGRFDIGGGGLGGFLKDLIKGMLKDLMQEYVPPWGQQLIIALGNINDIVDDMRVVSRVQKTPIGKNRYMCSERWVLVEFDYKGEKISAPPETINEIGQVDVTDYAAHETCGVLFIDNHRINNTVGGLFKWAIGTALSIATCASGGSCYQTMDGALAQVLNCPIIAMQIEQLVMSVWSGAPSVSGLIEQVCESQKQKLIKGLNDELDGLTTKFSKLKLSGTVPIPAPGNESQLTGGKWFGTLSGGNFHGEFTASRY